MSGLSFGILASDKNINIDIYERQDACGKKILLTGNGRCNLNNTIMNESCYYSENMDFVHNFFNEYKPDFSFYENCGILIKDNNGYIYPVSNQASTVLNALVNENKRLGNNIILNTLIKSIELKNNKYLINNMLYDYVVIASGGMAGVYRENEFNCSKMLKLMGFKVNRMYPGLTRIISDDNFDKNLKGIRLDGVAKLVSKNNIIATEEGEIQFTEKGISGIPIFQLSLYIGKLLDNVKNSGVEKPYISLDLIPNMNYEALSGYIKQISSSKKDMLISDLLNGMSNNKFTEYVIKKCNLHNNDKLQKLSEKDINLICSLYKELKINIISLDSFKNAQVSTGGVSLDEMKSTFESKQYSKFFIIGEQLDFTGKCGGYNLAFALKSAQIAARNILKDINDVSV